MPEKADFINNNLSSGMSIEEIVDYLLQGKFNPIDERHLNYLQKQQA